MKIHIVKKGDTLYSLAKKFNVSLDQLIAMNPQLKDPNQLSVGMKVKVPSSSYSTGGYEVIHKHVVKEGDTLWKLSKAWGVPLNMMIAANPQLKNPNVLLVGQVVNIPKPGGEQVEDKVEENAPQVSPNNKKNTAPKPLAEVEQPKKEVAMPQATLEMKVEVIAEGKQEAAPEMKPEAKSEAIPIPIAPQESLSNINMMKPMEAKQEVAPIQPSANANLAKENTSVPIVTAKPTTPAPAPAPMQAKQPSSPHPMSKMSSTPNMNMNMQNASMANSNMPAFEQQSVNASNAMGSDLLANAVPCPEYAMYPNWCPPSPAMGMYGWSMKGSSCMKGQGVYLGNCPPGTIPMGNGEAMMYTQYNPYQAPIMPTLPVMENSANQSLVQMNNMQMPYEQMNASANSNYSAMGQVPNMSYSNIPSGIVSYETEDNYKKIKSRDDTVQSLSTGMQAEAGTSEIVAETPVDEIKKVQSHKPSKTMKKKTKVRAQSAIRPKRSSVPWINR